MNRLYKDLAWLWPMWGDIEEYREESELFAALIRKFARVEVRSLLDVGCGGGKNAFHLKRRFDVTGIDISEPMLRNARKLNPDLVFHPGDMRSFNLGCQFDAVFMNDSIAYMTTKEDLLDAFRCAHLHLRPGGVMLVLAEVCRETFRQNRTTVSYGKTDDPAKLIVIVEHNYDSNPEDNTYEATFVFLIWEGGKVRIEQDFHVLGLFPLGTWRQALGDAGFIVNEQMHRLGEESLPILTCVKPLTG